MRAFFSPGTTVLEVLTNARDRLSIGHDPWWAITSQNPDLATRNTCRLLLYAHLPKEYVCSFDPQIGANVYHPGLTKFYEDPKTTYMRAVGLFERAIRQVRLAQSTRQHHRVLLNYRP